MPVMTNNNLSAKGLCGVKRFLTSLFLGANIFTILLLWACCFSTFISTSEHPRLSLLGLVFPFFLLANLAFVLFWIIFKFRLTWIPLLGILIIWGYVQDYFPMHLHKSEKSEHALKIITYNVGGAKDNDMRNEIIEYCRNANADVLCFQENFFLFLDRPNVRSALDSLNYQMMKNGGLCILSKYPIVSDPIPINYPTRSNHSLACMIEYQGDTILVINNHLESTHLSPEEKTDIKEIIEDPNHKNVEEKGRLYGNKLSEAARFRGAQTDTICAMIDKYKNYSIIVCGDFNDTPISYTYQKINSLLNNAFRESGKGVGISYNKKGFYVRIDHLFHSKDWRSFDTRIDSHIQASDHYPLVSFIQKNTK